MVREQLCSVGHPDARQVITESGSPYLREGSLKLTPRGCDPPRNVIELKIVVVLSLNQLADLVVELCPVADRAGALGRHVRDTPRQTFGITDPEAQAEGAAGTRYSAAGASGSSAMLRRVSPIQR